MSTLNNQIVLTPKWSDYELIDSGNEEKLERFGKYIFIRPEPKALWEKTASETEWSKAVAIYQRSSTGGGQWTFKQKIEENWTIQRNNLRFSLRPTGFKHLGIFPEQSSQWDLIQKKITAAQRPINVLNLFAYTGGCTLAAAAAGAKVTHIDAAKDIVGWARKNAELSGLQDKPVRWIADDVLKFVRREQRRNVKYDAIIMDPPKFGRGTQSEVWKIEENLLELVQACKEILTSQPLFFLINTYSVSFSAITLGNILSQTMNEYSGTTQIGELATPHSANSLLLPHSIFSLWEDEPTA